MLLSSITRSSLFLSLVLRAQRLFRGGPCGLGDALAVNLEELITVTTSALLKSPEKQSLENSRGYILLNCLPGRTWFSVE